MIVKRLLITGFEPFGGEMTNPSWDALVNIPCTVGEYELIKLNIPVVFGRSAEIVIAKAEEMQVDAILCIGQAGGRDAVTPEMIGINLRHASIPDNDGNEPIDERIDKDGAAAYFTTFSARKISEAINSIGICSRVSYSAGAYVCNDVIYSLLRHFDGCDVKIGFIHVPYSADQNKEPSMPLEMIQRAIIKSIEVL